MIKYDFHNKEMKTKAYQTLFDSEVGQALWNFMQDPLVVRSLIVAVRLKKAPVAAISDLLLEKFGSSDTALANKDRLKQGIKEHYPADFNSLKKPPLRFDRIKQYIGILIKVVLFHHGYEVSSRNSSANDPAKIFSNSSRYRKT